MGGSGGGFRVAVWWPARWATCPSGSPPTQQMFFKMFLYICISVFVVLENKILTPMTGQFAVSISTHRMANEWTSVHSSHL